MGLTTTCFEFIKSVQTMNQEVIDTNRHSEQLLTKTENDWKDF